MLANFALWWWWGWGGGGMGNGKWEMGNGEQLYHTYPQEELNFALHGHVYSTQQVYK